MICFQMGHKAISMNLRPDKITHDCIRDYIYLVQRKTPCIGLAVERLGVPEEPEHLPSSGPAPAPIPLEVNEPFNHPSPHYVPCNDGNEPDEFPDLLATAQEKEAEKKRSLSISPVSPSFFDETDGETEDESDVETEDEVEDEVEAGPSFEDIPAPVNDPMVSSSSSEIKKSEEKRQELKRRLERPMPLSRKRLLCPRSPSPTLNTPDMGGPFSPISSDDLDDYEVPTP